MLHAHLQALKELGNRADELDPRFDPYAKVHVTVAEIWDEVKSTSMIRAMMHSRELLGPHTLRLNSLTTAHAGTALMHVLTTQATVVGKGWLDEAAPPPGTVEAGKREALAFLQPVPWLLQPYLCDSGASLPLSLRAAPLTAWATPTQAMQWETDGSRVDGWQVDGLPCMAMPSRG